MSTLSFIENQGQPVKEEGSQLRTACPGCGDQSHLYVDAISGACFCHKCGWKGNLFQWASAMTSDPPAVINAALKEHGMDDPPKPRHHKVMQLQPADHRPMNDREYTQVCEAKGISAEALVRFEPHVHVAQPWMLLPAYTPEDSKPVGWMRVHMRGGLIKVGDKQEKYPMVAGSKHGLLGLPWLMEHDPPYMLFCEGWRDALAAMRGDMPAIASTGGASTWRDEWLRPFRDRNVGICMDADEAGERQAARVYKKIKTVAKKCKVIRVSTDVAAKNGVDLYDYLEK